METSYDDLFTFLSPWKALNRTFDIYRSRWLLFTQLQLIAIIPHAALTIVLRKTLAVNVNFFDTTQDAAILFRLIEVMSFCLFNIIIQAAIVQVVAEYYAHKMSTLKESLSLTSDRFGDIICFAFCNAFLYYGILEGTLILLLSGAPLIIRLCTISYFIIMLDMALGLPVVVLDKQRACDAFKRSGQLHSEPYCYFTSSMLLLVVPVLLGVGFYSLALEEMFGTCALSIVLKGLPVILFLPLTTILVTVLYFSIRVHGEGLNRETFVRQFEGDSGAENYENMIEGGPVV